MISTRTRIKLEPAFHQSHVWWIDQVGSDWSVKGKCGSASATWQLTAAEFAEEPVFSYAFEPPPDPYANALKLDGLLATYKIRTASGMKKCRLFCPAQSYAYEYWMLTLVCWEGLYGECAAYDKHLEDLFGYFHDWGPPAFVRGKTLKIFGNLTDAAVDEIQGELSLLAESDDPVVDMTRCDGVTPAVSGIFRQLEDKCHPKWLANAVAGQYLDSMGIPYALIEV